MESLTGLKFTKMAGGGNDFVVIDVRAHPLPEAEQLALAVCTRRLSVGADGLILVDQGDGADVRMLYYNADGSRAEFCANGTRCAARFAVLNGIADDDLTIEADCGILRARVLSDDRVELAVDGPTAYDGERILELEDGRKLTGAWMKIGVPHYVVFVDEPLWKMDIDETGSEVRHHPDLHPEGANANFVRLVDRSRIDVRTWERGVEGETLSCGSGVVASVAGAALNGHVASPVSVRTRSGITYTVEFESEEGRLTRLLLTGDARVVFNSQISDETLVGFDPEWVRVPSDRDPEIR